IDDLRSAGYVDYLGNILELDVIVTLYEQHAFRAGLEDIGKTVAEIVPAHVVLIDLQFRFSAARGFQHLDHHGTVRFVRLRVWWRRLRNQSLEPVRRQRCDHHEDDEQHQQYVDQGGDVDIGGLSSARSTH